MMYANNNIKLNSTTIYFHCFLFRQSNSVKNHALIEKNTDKLNFREEKYINYLICNASIFSLLEKTITQDNQCNIAKAVIEE